MRSRWTSARQLSGDNHSGEDPDFARIRASIHGGAVTQRDVPVDPARCELLELESSSAGARWAACCRDELRKQSRQAAGGWPGTMSEARAHVAAYIGTELRRRGMGALTHQESELAARAVYAAARRHWLLRREPEASEP